jgi:hypothetical protein
MNEDINNQLASNVQLLRDHITRLESVLVSMQDIGNRNVSTGGQQKLRAQIQDIREGHLTAEPVRLQRQKAGSEGKGFVSTVFRLSRRQALSQLAGALNQAIRRNF